MAVGTGEYSPSSWNTKGTLLEELGNTASMSSWNTKGYIAGGIGEYSQLELEY